MLARIWMHLNILVYHLPGQCLFRDAHTSRHYAPLDAGTSWNVAEHRDTRPKWVT